jgi:hypothetical protein
MLYACPPKMSIVSGRYVLCDFEEGDIFFPNNLPVAKNNDLTIYPPLSEAVSFLTLSEALLNSLIYKVYNLALIPFTLIV